MTENRSAYLDALHILARRDLSTAECRERLARKGHAIDEIDSALERLAAGRALDDLRVARAFARTAIKIKGRGPLRIERELQARGIDRDIAAEALADACADEDEPTMIARAIRKRLRGRALSNDRAESARLFQHLVRQGYTPSAIVAELRKLRDN